MSMRSKNDRLSTLPEEIQSHILSLMPTKFAVQTCVLSKRWRYTWMSITNLDFDDEPPLGFSNMETFVDRVLECCKSSQIESLRLNFSRIVVHELSVLIWIDEAVRLNVRELDIQYKLFQLPQSLFTSTTLTKLKICLGYLWECASVVSLPCLKTLDIAVFDSPFASAFKLIAGSPMLENLSFQVVMYSGVKDFLFDIPTLKRLELHLFDSENTIKLVLRVPKLEHLLSEGTYSVFVMEDVSSLIEASFSFEGKSFDYHMVELLKGTSGVKLLSLEKVRDTQTQDSSFLKIISASPLPVFANMERLELKGFWHLELIFKFLESSPELKEICIETLQGSRWIAPKVVPACMLTKLATIKFLNFKWRNSDVQLFKFLSGNAKVLKMLTVNLEKSSLKEETWLVQQLLNIRRASRCCVIQIHRS